MCHIDSSCIHTAEMAPTSDGCSLLRPASFGREPLPPVGPAMSGTLSCQPSWRRAPAPPSCHAPASSSGPSATKKRITHSDSCQSKPPLRTHTLTHARTHPLAPDMIPCRPICADRRATERPGERKREKVQPGRQAAQSQSGRHSMLARPSMHERGERGGARGGVRVTRWQK